MNNILKKFLKHFGLPKDSCRISDKKPHCRYAAFYDSGMIYINDNSIETFLHELSHHINSWRDGFSGAHSKNFFKCCVESTDWYNQEYKKNIDYAAVMDTGTKNKAELKRMIDVLCAN